MMGWIKIAHLALIILIAVVLWSPLHIEATEADTQLEAVLSKHEVGIFTLRKKLEPLQVQRKPKDRLDIFCYDGEWEPLPQRVPKLWTTANLKLAITSDDYELFSGYNESHVYSHYRQAQTSYIKWTMPWRADNLQLSPFNKTCIGISTKQDYAVRFSIKVLDPWLLTYLLIGLILFLTAHRLSRNVLFYYGTGISVGIMASLLILVYIMGKFLPYKKGAYVVLAGGWSLVLWCLRYVWDNYATLLETNWQYVVGYFLTAGIISFAVCYWKGPVTNDRSLNLIKWTIQGIGMAFLYNCSQIPEVSVAIIVAVLTIYNFPRRVTNISKKIWRRLVPQKLRLLTEEEYLQQGNEETRKALEELRTYCKSPDCDAWKVISRLTTPHRFAKWVEGDSHLSDDELMSYEDDPAPYPTTPEISEDEIDFRLGSQ